MAITESETTQQGGGEPHRRRHPWRWVLLALGALLAAAVVVLAILAGTYQPIQFGGGSGGPFNGLPAGTGIRFVNTFGGQQGDTYVPPQLGVFTITESIYNAGPEPVTIEAISILDPLDQVSGPRAVPPGPFNPAGSVRWLPANYRLHQEGSPVVRVSLAPDRSIVIGIPVRMNGPCYDPNGWTSTNVFYVKERFLFFTHWVAVQFPIPILLHQPSYPGNEPSKDLACLSK
jgi:hypothetical protein